MPEHRLPFFPVILEKQPNFRDIGGIPAINGRMVRTGLLFRSGDLSRLTEEDILKMEQLGIRMIIDFRSDREVIQYPDPNLRTVQEHKRIVIPDLARDAAERMVTENDADGLETILIRDYRRVVNDHHNDFREFFRVLATTRNLPLVYHCAAGKDRTGLATYLLLRALGVTDAEARRDYLLSNVFLKPIMEKIIRKLTEKGKNGEMVRPLLEVREEYLTAAVDEIHLKFGRLDFYLQEVLQANTTVLRERYLR